MGATEEEVREIVRAVLREMRVEISNTALAAAKEAVRQDHEHLFSELGYDIANREDLKRLRSNMDFLDSLHAGTKVAGARALFIIVSTLIGAILLAMAEGARAFLVGK